LLPICNRPLIETQVRSLARRGFREVGIAVSPDVRDDVLACLGDGRDVGVRVEYACDPDPAGPAGCLRMLRDFVGKDAFVVISGATFLGSADLGALVDAHRRQRAVATLGMFREENRDGPLQWQDVKLGDNGRVERFDIRHASCDRRRRGVFGGVYCFDSKVFDWIPGAGHADIKEQLIPRLCDEGLTVVAQWLQGTHNQIDSIREYERVNKQLLESRGFEGNHHVAVAEEVWAAADAQVSSGALVVGPVLIGDRCVIEEGARIIGPTVIGEGTHIGRDALVRDSILWNDSVVGARARVEYSIVGAGCELTESARLRREILMPDEDVSKYRDKGQDGGARGDDSDDPSSGGVEQPVMAVHRPGAKVRRWVQVGTKQLLDVTAAAAGLVLCAPMLVILAALVKLDSPGPILFKQRRCGRNGKPFTLYKFRTMCAGASDMQPDYRSQNDVDGPMFKMFDDPRVTRMGRFLRDSGLDELPQLLNVVRGDMSLVGPRPLAMHEMSRCPSWRDLRLGVRPGITGLWQIQDRSGVAFHEWIQHDAEYVKRWSLRLDFEILGKTALWAAARVFDIRLRRGVQA
jgi:lipopolysaccharide/colanic/teichoic acid biosynthesis glycosyltransferase/dTDP-glucose pyrophosphorylase